MKKIILPILLIIIILGYIYINNKKTSSYINQESDSADEVERVDNQQVNVGKVEEVKDKYKITYKYEEYKVKEDTTDYYIVSKRNLPVITNAYNKKAAEKIVDSLTKFSNIEWNSIKDASDAYSDLTYEGLGVNLIISTGSITSGRLTFTLKLDGGFGGVSWIHETGYNYDSKTGELLTLNNISNNNDDNVKNTVKKYLFSVVEKKYINGSSCIYDNWKSTFEKDFDNYGWYFTPEGIRIIIPKYGIACGAGGIISVVVEKDSLKNNLKDEYRF